MHTANLVPNHNKIANNVYSEWISQIVSSELWVYYIYLLHIRFWVGLPSDWDPWWIFKMLSCCIYYVPWIISSCVSCVFASSDTIRLVQLLFYYVYACMNELVHCWVNNSLFSWTHPIGWWSISLIGVSLRKPSTAARLHHSKIKL